MGLPFAVLLRQNRFSASRMHGFAVRNSVLASLPPAAAEVAQGL